jgi:luciferase family oxidoreductase group 1
LLFDFARHGSIEGGRDSLSAIAYAWAIRTGDIDSRLLSAQRPSRTIVTTDQQLRMEQRRITHGLGKVLPMSDHQNDQTPIQLGVLDSWTHVPDTIALAEEADRLGYARYWLTEHPPQPNPQTIAALVAGVTENMRVGTAGILLHFHVPLAAAQQFLLLEQVFPGRIDAGFCGGGAADLVAEALLDGRPDPRRDAAAPDQRAATLIGFLRGDLPAGHRYETLGAWPEAKRTPEIWSFGTGLRSAELAARHGTAFGYSLFHNFSKDELASVDAYRDGFRPSPWRPKPLVSVSVAGVCAETERDARALREAYQNKFIVPSVVGTPRQCREQLEAIGARYGTRELMFLDVSPDLESRLRSCRMLAEACGLAPTDELATHRAVRPEFEMICPD